MTVVPRRGDGYSPQSDVTIVDAGDHLATNLALANCEDLPSLKDREGALF